MLPELPEVLPGLDVKAIKEGLPLSLDRFPVRLRIRYLRRPPMNGVAPPAAGVVPDAFALNQFAKIACLVSVQAQQISHCPTILDAMDAAYD
jgi:hypothetical protein